MAGFLPGSGYENQAGDPAAQEPTSRVADDQPYQPLAAGFANKPVLSQWQLIKMPTAPLVRLELTIFDQPESPYRFESFLNVAEEDQAGVLDRLANQDRLYFSFYGGCRAGSDS